MIHLALTGHRPPKLWGYNMNAPEYIDLQQALQLLITKSLTKYGQVTCHSGMALGADTVWAKAITTIKDMYPEQIHFIAHVPCRGQEKKWPMPSQDTFNELIDQADDIIYYSETYTKQCMQLRNIGMINACNILIAVSNGDDTGGTANAIKYASKKNIPIHTIPIK